MATLIERQDNNFWTEGAKVIRFEDLVRIDMKQKIKKIENQVIDSKEFHNVLYNYDYFLSDKSKAIQFISDYADDFSKALNRFYKETGKMFSNVGNPSMMVNLMVTYKAKDIAQELAFVKENEKIVMNMENKNILLEQLNTGMSPELYVYKIFERNEQLKDFIGKDVEVNDLTVKTLLKNSYHELMANVTPDVLSGNSIHLVSNILETYPKERAFQVEKDHPSKTVIVNKEREK